MQDCNLCNVGQIFKDNKIISFSELLSKFNMNESSFLSYLQLKAVITKITSKGSNTGSDEHLDNTLKKFANGRGLASGIYKLLLRTENGDVCLPTN